MKIYIDIKLEKYLMETLKLNNYFLKNTLEGVVVSECSYSNAFDF